MLYDKSMLSRVVKQGIIAGIFFLILGGIGFGIFRAVIPPTPTPTPNPTIHLAPLQVITSKLLNITNNDYDFVAKIRNANLDYGSGRVEYRLTIYGVDAQPLVTKTGSFYILPGQTKHVIVTPIRLEAQAARAEFSITMVDWQQLNQLASQGIDIIPRNVALSKINQPGTYAKVGGNVFNNSDLDLDIVDVAVIVSNFNGDIVAVNKTDIRTFVSKTQRGFEVAWPSAFLGQPDRVEAEATTNVFNNLNFLRQYGGQERFQQLY